MKARLSVPSRNGIFVILMACSAILMLLPTRWTGGLKCVQQVLIPFQDGMYAITAGPTLGEEPPAVSAEEYQQVVSELEAKRNEIVSLHLLIREIEAEHPAVTLILQRLVDRASTRESKLVPARVIAYDPSSWRDTALLGAGRSRGVDVKDWVASRRLLDAGEKDGVQQGMTVLAREYLIGYIDEVTPYSSRLVLLSDDTAQVQVWIGRVEREQFNILPSLEALRDGKRSAGPGGEAGFLLTGRGRDEMIISGVHEDYVHHKALAVGDLVVSAGSSAKLPVAMVIGKVEKIEDDPAQRQLRRLIVRCPVDTSRLRWVYVVSAPPRSDLPTD